MLYEYEEMMEEFGRLYVFGKPIAKGTNLILSEISLNEYGQAIVIHRTENGTILSRLLKEWANEFDVPFDPDNIS